MSARCVGLAAGGTEDGGGAAAPPAGLLREVQALTSSLGTLSPLLAPDGLLGSVLGGGLSLNSLVRATGVNSAAAVRPAGGALQAVAGTRVGDLQVLPLAAPLLRGIAGGLPADVSTGLLQRLGSLADLPLLDIKGANSSAQAALGSGSASPKGSAGFAEIDVLGAPVASAADALAIPPGSERDVHLPGTGVTLQISRGLPVVGFDTPLHRSVSVTGLELRLVGDGDGALSDLLGGSTATAGRPIVDVSVAGAAADVAAAPDAGGATPASGLAPVLLSAAQAPLPPSTGVLTGPVPLGAAAALALLAGVGIRPLPRGATQPEIP